MEPKTNPVMLIPNRYTYHDFQEKNRKFGQKLKTSPDAKDHLCVILPVVRTPLNTKTLVWWHQENIQFDDLLKLYFWLIYLLGEKNREEELFRLYLIKTILFGYIIHG